MRTRIKQIKLNDEKEIVGYMHFEPSHSILCNLQEVLMTLSNSIGIGHAYTLVQKGARMCTGQGKQSIWGFWGTRKTDEDLVQSSP